GRCISDLSSFFPSPDTHWGASPTLVSRTPGFLNKSKPSWGAEVTCAISSVSRRRAGEEPARRASLIVDRTTPLLTEFLDYTSHALIASPAAGSRATLPLSGLLPVYR